MKKRCFSCGVSFELSGSGKRQKYCQKCSSRGVHRGRGLPTSNPLKTKGAGKHFSAPLPVSVREQIEVQKHQPNPVFFTTADGRNDMVWLGVGASRGATERIIGDDRHWRVHVAEAIKLAAEEAKERKAKRSKASKPINLMGGCVRGKTDPQRGSVALRQAILDTELAPPLKGFTVRLIFEDEAPAIGSGHRLVLVQFRGKKVILHGGGYTATIKRNVFKELVASNRRYRKRNQAKPSLRLIVGGSPKPQLLVQEEAA